MIKAIIFDFDGVIVESVQAAYLYLHQLLGKHGYKRPTFEQVREVFFLNYTDQLKALTGEKVEEKITELIEDPMRKQFPLHLIRAIDGVKEVLEELGRDYRLALVTNANLNYVKTVLDSHGLSKYFEVVVTAEDTTARKPNPKPLLIAAKKLGVSPNEVVSVGDYPTDIEASHAAGMKVIFFSKTENSGDDPRIDSMRELPAAVKNLSRKKRLSTV